MDLAPFQEDGGLESGLSQEGGDDGGNYNPDGGYPI